MVLQRVEQVVAEVLSEKNGKQSRLNSIGIFDRDINEVRVRSSLLVELRRRLDIAELAKEAAAQLGGDTRSGASQELEARLNTIFASSSKQPSGGAHGRRRSVSIHPRGSAQELRKSLQFDINSLVRRVKMLVRARCALTIFRNRIHFVEV